MSKQIIGCPGYYLADDKKTILDENGKAVGGKKDYITITVNENKHNVQRAKLAWCALNDINPFEVSDDYIFYYIKGEPRKRTTSAVSSQTRLSDIEFQKTLKSWAEKQGFYNHQKYIEKMHDFIEKHNVRLTDDDDYCVFKMSERDRMVFDSPIDAPGLQNENDNHKVNIDRLVYLDFEFRAKKHDMTVDEYVNKLLESLPYDMDDTKLMSLVKEAGKEDKNVWDYIFERFENCSNPYQVQDQLKSQIALLESEIKRLMETLKRSQHQPSQNETLFPLKQFLPPFWYVKAMNIIYCNDTTRQRMTIDLYESNNNAVAGEMPENEPEYNFEKCQNMYVDDFIDILFDAKQRLIFANSWKDDPIDEGKFGSDEHYFDIDGDDDEPQIWEENDSQDFSEDL